MNPHPMTARSGPPDRIAAIRAEIAAAEAKRARLTESIQARKQALNRLEATAVLNGTVAPVRKPHE